MWPLLAPILAQAVTLNVADRTEARYLVADDKRMEGSTRPLVGLNFGWQHSNLTLGYSPVLTVSPLERSPRDAYVFHNAYLVGSYRWRRTTFTLTESAGYGDISFRVQPVADPGAVVAVGTPTGPAAPSPTPGTPATGPTVPGGTTGGGITNGTTTPPNSNPQGTNQLRIRDQIARYFTWTTAAAVVHQLSRSIALGADANYSEGSGVGASRAQYPLLRGARVNAFASYTVISSRRDAFTSIASSQYAISSTGNRVFGVQAGESWLHSFSALTVSRLGAGLSLTRQSQDDGLIAYSIYPTFLAGITHFDRLAGGVATCGLSLTATPYFDPLRATVDPRLAVGGTAGWSRRRFGIAASAGAAISLFGDDAQNKGAVNSVGASLGARYVIATPVSVDAGVATGWQTFNGGTVIPASWTAFLGLTFAAALPLNGTPR